MKNILIKILRVLMLFILFVSWGIGYVIYEDTLTEWWIPVGVALMIAAVTFPFYKFCFFSSDYSTHWKIMKELLNFSSFTEKNNVE